MEVIESPAVLTIRPYEKDRDYRTVLQWWRMRGAEGELHLPPLGVVVEDGQGPVCALWCAEPAGFAVAYLEFPIARPGLGLAEARAAFSLAVHGIMELAGKGWNPPGLFTSFRAVTPAPLARILMRMGFVRETGDELIPMIFTRKNS